jgi:uncharacterized protein YpuA (DUF1002 family)
MEVFMLRAMSLFLAWILVAAAATAQNPPDQSSMPGSTGQQNMSAMHDQMMKSMQADLDTMRSNLQKMKDQLKKVSDQSARDQLQLNIDMWTSLLDNMDKHLTMMKSMTGQGRGRMMHGQQPSPSPKK